MTQCRTDNALFSSGHEIQIRESTVRARVCESSAHPVFNQSSGGYSFAFKAVAVAFARWNFLLHAAKKKQRRKIYCVFAAK